MPLITRLMLQNFKKFPELDLRFTHDRNILVGDNESGKSTILLALDLVLSDSRHRVEALGVESLLSQSAVRGGKREPQKIPPFRIVEFFGGVVRGMTTRQRLPHLSEALWRDAETPGNSATPVPGPQ